MSATSTAWPTAVYTTSQVRGFDRHAIDVLGIEGFELMRRAGAAALRFLQAKWPDTESLTIFCGAGNNGGDGYVLAALAVRAGLRARVVAVVDPASLGGAAAQALVMARESGVAIDDWRPAAAGDAAGRAGAGGDLIVDALLGTGLTRDVGGALAEAVAAINAAGRPVLALDVPTGLDSDTGEIRGIAVEAHATISFVGLKTGLYLGSGPARTGVIGFSDLGLPAAVYADAMPALRRIDRAAPARLLRPRSRTAHKGLNGRVLVVGGAPGMAGAARLAAEAALRSGAGLVHAAVAPGSVGAVMAGRPEIMCRGVEAVADFSDWIDAADVIVLGPGLGRTDWSERLASALLDADKPAVVDADALHYLAQHPTRREDWVLTPHPGEAGALLDWSAVEVQSARERAVVGIAARFGGIAVLKGACSLIAQVSDKNASDKNKHPVAVCDRGNPGMASGGMGDVLSGVVAGLIAQYGLSAPVVECAVLVHARAGDDAAAEGERGLVASDLFLHLRRQVNPH